jgi:hypothetical protein
MFPGKFLCMTQLMKVLKRNPCYFNPDIHTLWRTQETMYMRLEEEVLMEFWMDVKDTALV